MRRSFKRSRKPRAADAQLRYWSLRWSVPNADSTSQEALQAYLPTLFEKWIYQLENSRLDNKENPNFHYQGTAYSLDSTRESTLKRAFNSNGFNGLDVSPASTPGITALQNYCIKSKSYVAGPWCETGKLLVEKPYDCSELKYISEHPRPFQKFFMDLFPQEPDDRKIYWIYDPVGRAGKSNFVKYSAYHYKANFIGWCRYADAANLVRGSKNRRIFLFDLTRDKPRDISNSDLYSAIESIKSGLINNTKYQTESLFFSNPHVVVFSNSLPEFSKLSADRWDVREVSPDFSLVPYERKTSAVLDALSMVKKRKVEDLYPIIDRWYIELKKKRLHVKNSVSPLVSRNLDAKGSEGQNGPPAQAQAASAVDVSEPVRSASSDASRQGPLQEVQPEFRLSARAIRFSQAELS